VVAHDGIGTQVNGKNGTQKFDAIDDPLTAVLEVKACLRILATKEGPAYTSRDAMVIRCIFN